MKTKKKITDDLNKVIQGGKAQVEQVEQKQKLKRRATYFLSEEVLEMIAQNCRGNKSYFIEEAVKYFLENQSKV